MTTPQGTEAPFNPALAGLADFKVRKAASQIAAMNVNGAASAVVAEATGSTNEGQQTTSSLQVSPLVRAGRRFHHAVLLTAALCLTESRRKEDLDKAILWADERIVKDDHGDPITSVVAFTIVKGDKHDLLRGKVIDGVPKGFDVTKDVIVPIKTINVRYVSDEDADDIRGSLGALKGYLLKPRKPGAYWTFIAWGLAPEREIDILNELFEQMGRSSQQVRMIENDIHAPGLRITDVFATSMTKSSKEQGGGHVIGNHDGKIMKLAASSQQPPLGKVFQAWYVELESVVIYTFAGWPGSIDMSMRPTALQLGYGMDFEAVLGVKKEYLGLNKIEALRDELLDTAVEAGHPTYDYLLSIGLLSEGDDIDFKIGQVSDAINEAAKMATEEMKHIAQLLIEHFAVLQIPKLAEILEGVDVADFKNATAGEDMLTKLVGGALEEAFDWDMPLHVLLRCKLLERAVAEAELDEQESETVALPEVIVNHTIMNVKVKYDGLAMLSIHAFTAQAVDARVHDLTHGGDLSQIVAAYATLGVTFDLQDKKQFERLIAVIAFLGDKVKAAIG